MRSENARHRSTLTHNNPASPVFLYFIPSHDGKVGQDEGHDDDEGLVVHLQQPGDLAELLAARVRCAVHHVAATHGLRDGLVGVKGAFHGSHGALEMKRENECPPLSESRSNCAGADMPPYTVRRTQRVVETEENSEYSLSTAQALSRSNRYFRMLHPQCTAQPESESLLHTPYTSCSLSVCGVLTNN